MAGIENLEEHLARLNRIGIALSSERDLNKLLTAILQEARAFTHAEGGTLYAVEGDKLWFLATQNDALGRRGERADCTVPHVGQHLPLSPESMAGYVGLTGEVINLEDVYLIPPDRPYHFNQELDRRHDYRTQSMLMVPMKDADGHILGVLQLINALDEVGRVVLFDRRWEDLIMSLASQAAVAMRNVKLTEELKAAYMDTIFRLSVAAEYKDQETANHIRRVAHYSAVLADELGFDPDRIEIIRCAAPMHDVGKIGIPEAILQKPGKLTPDEYSEMKRHTLFGAHIFDGAEAPLLKTSATVALTHHEKYDGTGYPRGLQGSEIPIEGQIVALADVFDALSSDRCYKPAYPIGRCLEIIQTECGRHFHPDVIRAFTHRLTDILAVRQRYAPDPIPPANND
ncbi:MAG TPA: HD domain-containing phosphohydrolase [Phycisphaerae bacterium]|nr:HD domain-containing phosphohydrolase [Phycisphaerae bacterium]